MSGDRPISDLSIRTMSSQSCIPFPLETHGPRSCLIPSSILFKKELLSKKHTLREKVVFFNNGSSPLLLLANILWISKRMGNLSLCGFGTFEVGCTLVLDWWVPFGNLVWCTNMMFRRWHYIMNDISYPFSRDVDKENVATRSHNEKGQCFQDLFPLRPYTKCNGSSHLLLPF